MCKTVRYALLVAILLSAWTHFTDVAAGGIDNPPPPAAAPDPAAWGDITGTLADQTDLGTALNARQPLDSDLTAIAALTTTAFGRGLLAGADAAALQTSAGTVIGTNVEAWDADLDSIAAVATTAFGRGLLASADAAALRTTAGAVGNSLTVTGTAPSIAAGAAAGGSPTIAVAGRDPAFVVDLTSGTLPSVSDVIATVTLTATKAAAPVCAVSGANAAAAGALGSVYLTSTTTTVVLNATSVALVGATSYLWNVVCVVPG